MAKVRAEVEMTIVGSSSRNAASASTKNPISCNVEDEHKYKDDQDHNNNAEIAWCEEEIDKDLKWSFALNSVAVRKGKSEHQDIALLDTKRFGKVLMIDNKMQSAENDEFVYHESLIHPALFIHPNPKSVFIMGGGEGSAAREVLKHKSIDRVVICDIDKAVVDFCREHLTANQEAFNHTKLQLIINDAKAVLEETTEKFSVIVGDLADPVEGGPCYQLYTKPFYEKILKPRLSHDGIFVTQAGPAGIHTHKKMFAPIYHTIKQVFKYVMAYTAHVPSFADTWGWVLASDHPHSASAPEEADKRLLDRIDGELLYFDASTFISSNILIKPLAQSLLRQETLYHGAAFTVADQNCRSQGGCCTGG